MPRSQTERMWLIGGGLVAFVLLLVGYFFFIGPQRSETSDVQSDATSAQSQNLVLHARINSLREQTKQLPKYRADLAAAHKALPTTSGISDFLRTLQSLGNSTLTDVTSLTVGAPTDVSTIAAGTPTGAAASSAPSSAPSSSPAPGAAATPATGGVFGLPITAQVSGTPDALNRFLAQLQSVQPRAVLITQITEGSDGAGAGTTTAKGKTTLQLTMQAFVAPSDASEKADLSAASGR